MKTQASDAAVRQSAFEARMWRAESTGTREERQEDGTWKDVPTTHPAQWAVYDIESGIRLAYAHSENDARTAADKWNSGKIPEAIKNKAESARDLRNLLKPGDTVSTILRSVSRSGMMRRISLVIARNNEVLDITWDAARVFGDPVKQRGRYVQDAGMVVEGCGMDMGFHLVYNLSSALFPDGFECIGRDEKRAIYCPANDHCNGDRNYKPHMHPNAGGYALNHRWI